MRTLDLLKQIKKETRTTIRVTAIKGMNMGREKEWAALLKKAEPMFIEVKGYVFVGASRQKLNIDNMPRHPEVQEFAQAIAKELGYQVIDEQVESRVVLLMKEDSPDRMLQWDWEVQEKAMKIDAKEKAPAIEIQPQ